MWLFCTAKTTRISVSDCGSRTEPSWRAQVPGASLGRCVPAPGAGPALGHRVSPAPGLSHCTAVGKQQRVEEGVRDVQWLWPCWAGLPSPDGSSPWGWVCQKGPCLSMHTIFSPQAPSFSLTSQPFSQTLSPLVSPQELGREWGSFPKGPLLKVALGWPRPPPSPVPVTRTLSLFATTTKESWTQLFILPCSGFNSAKPLSRRLWVGPGLRPSLSAFLNKGLNTPSEQVVCHSKLSYQWDCLKNDQRKRGRFNWLYKKRKEERGNGTVLSKTR